MDEPQGTTVCVLKSAAKRYEYERTTDRLRYSDVRFVGFYTTIIHDNNYASKGNTSVAAIIEMCDLLEIEHPYTDTLTRGGVHEHRHDPLNGFMQNSMGMSYCVWPWKTVINWLLTGWPVPSHTGADAKIGTWCWHTAKPLILPVFLASEIKQLKAMRVPREVIDGKRGLTELEAVDVAATVLSKQKVQPRNKYFRNATNK